MRASLPMYDLPAVRAATDRWWAGLAAHFRAAGLAGVPRRLARERPPNWDDPELLFSQTCGYPLTHRLAGRVTPLCTPVYKAPGCDGMRYASALVVAADSPAAGLADLRGGVCAINGRDSHSGCNVLRSLVAPLAQDGHFFADLIVTGGHAASIARVGRGEADLCAVDAVSHALLARHAPEQLVGTRVLGFSPSAPGLPYIAGPAVTRDERQRMREAIGRALEDPSLAPARENLLIAGAEDPPLVAYDEIVAMERDAQGLGYAELH